MRQVESVVAVIMLALLAALDDTQTIQDGAPGGLLGRLAGTVRDRMLDVVGPDEIVERLDINAVLDRVDVDDLLDRVDVDDLLARVDVNALLARVDVDALLDQVDVDQVVDRVDPDRLLARVDIDAFMDRLDVERLVQRAGLPDIVAESTGSIVETALDLLRRQLLALDVVIARGVMGLLRRDDASLPAGPERLAGDGGPSHALPTPSAAVTDVTGHYAGPMTRLVAYVIDITIATSAFAFATGALSSLLRAMGVPTGGGWGGAVYAASLATWLFVYWWAATAVAGRTPGMAIVGLRIVTRTGDPLSGRRAFLRVVVLPVSIAIAGLGLVGIVVGRERRALHDVVAGSTVVFDWGDRRVTLPTPLARWLARHSAPIDGGS